MSIFMYVRFFLECAAVGLTCYAVYREKDLIILERKAWKYVKAFFKAVYFTLKDKIHSKKATVVATPVSNYEFEEMLKSLNKNSKIDGYRIAS